jgi:arylsulfatase B
MSDVIIRFGAFLLFVASSPLASGAPLPNLFFLLLDDYGWANIGYHNKNSTEIVTPNLDALAAGGVILDRHYVHKFCSPTRSALQTGRSPIHVNVLNSPLSQHNPKDNIGGFQGIPRNMTGIAEKLKGAGYSTHMFGKWHAGLATAEHTPHGRGYDTALNYLGAANDYYTNSYLQPCAYPTPADEFTARDLWDTSAPARGQNNSASCSQANQAPECVYEDALFASRVLSTIRNASNASGAPPLFLVWAPHSVHEPYEVPDAYLAKFAAIDVPARRFYAAMTNFIDDQVGAVVAALRASGLWDNLLLVVSSDNGGPLAATRNVSGLAGISGANNWPLRGGKMGNLEGGVRVNAFAAGGLLPPAVRGTVSEAFVAVEDWYATFCALAGVNATDEKAAAAGLPPVDGLDLWPVLSGARATSGRRLQFLGSSDDSPDKGNTIVQGVIRVADGYKLLIGDVNPAFWQGPTFPNASNAGNFSRLVCGDPDARGSAKGPGCLFNVLEDPSETRDLAAVFPHFVVELRTKITEAQATVYNPDRGGPDNLRFCKQAIDNGGFIGPFLP